jgi:predicted AAA+ superfamily ATPase
LNEVHRFIEEKRLRFVLCGSSARKLKRSGVNLLAGRALRKAMHPFVPEEPGPIFNLDEALRFGLLPIVWDSNVKDETLAAYAQLYLKEIKLCLCEKLTRFRTSCLWLPVSRSNHQCDQHR